MGRRLPPTPTPIMTAECTAEGARTNPIDTRLDALVEGVSSWSALFVGVLTVVLANEIAAVLPFGSFYRALALLPITIAVMYVLLVLAVRLERRGR
ncbi:hypothetical protein [Halococcus saccharolyticus]|uniref:Uncharacterized protein n=1 Tax=Halococcus saccharolyticus DSM 5350 TaxID=1227455 RepID=M0MIY6_9EURY|nr:hypothetical protein [Halococcus saccharolyticus]EMA45318.1 hypothetical protein C449_06825 [Halococcus saccharolyticus DSM 5350]